MQYVKMRDESFISELFKQRQMDSVFCHFITHHFLGDVCRGHETKKQLFLKTAGEQED